MPNGLRMAGTYYGPGGANIEFLEDKAIVGCNVTRDENPYTVAFRHGEVIVDVEGAGAPLAFKLNLDGTLVGNGASISIYGQKVVGKNKEGDPVYAASSDTCAYGALSPHGENSAATVAPAATVRASNPAPQLQMPVPRLLPHHRRRLDRLPYRVALPAKTRTVSAMFP